MGVVSLSRFRSEPGHAGKHLELHLEACQRLRGMGMQAAAMQPIAGGDIGSLVMSVNHASYAEYVASIKTMQADQGWQDFYAGAMATGAAVQVESSLFNDGDPSFQPAAGRPLGVILALQWSVKPGRLDDFVANVMASMAHIERMGGRPRPLQSVVGAHPMTTLYTTAFEDLDAYAAYADKVGTDPEWQAFWADLMKDPSGDVIRSGLYLNISDG